MIQQCAEDIGAKVMAQLEWVTAWKCIARQDPTGVIVHFVGGEQWVGIDDRRSGAAYCRFREGVDAMFADAKLTSARDATTTYRMRAVFMHHCSNDTEIARFFAWSIMSAQNWDLRYMVRLRSMSSDKQWILQQEAKKAPDSGIPDDNLNLALVDFDVTVRDTILEGATCVPPCDAC